MGAWQDAVEKYPAVQLDWAFRRHFAESEYFPKPANIADRIQTANQILPEYQKKTGEPCIHCGDMGWLYVEESGSKNVHVKRCFCGRGKENFKATSTQLKEYGIAKDSPEANKFWDTLKSVGLMATK